MISPKTKNAGRENPNGTLEIRIGAGDWYRISDGVIENADPIEAAEAAALAPSHWKYIGIACQERRMYCDRRKSRCAHTRFRLIAREFTEAFYYARSFNSECGHRVYARGPECWCPNREESDDAQHQRRCDKRYWVERFDAEKKAREEVC
jgi:hypothetical protein